MKHKNLLFNVLAVLAGITILSLTAADSIKNQDVTLQKTGWTDHDSYHEYFMSIRNNQITGTIDPADVLEAKQMKLKSAGYEPDIVWENAGPDNFGGRTRAVLYDIRDAEYKTIYAASTSGGIWKSVTGGITWESVPGTGNIMNVTSMVQASNGKIYVGTGETFRVFQYSAYPGFMGNGVFVSSETGDNFELLTSTQPVVNDSLSEWAYVNELAVHPSSPSKLYAATHTGLKYSSDGGNSWVTATDIDNNILNFPMLDVKIGSDGITVATGNSRVYISDNGDPENFVNHSTGVLPAGLPFADITRIEAAIAPSNPNYIYCVAAKGGASVGQLENIYLSVNRGETWRVVGPGSSNLFFNLFGPDNIGQYANTILVYPDNPDMILVGGMDMWKGVKVQEDGYYEWLNKTGGSIEPDFIGSKHHSYAFKPDNINTLIIGTDRGIFISTDELKTFQNLNRNYITSQCYSVGFNSGKKMILGTQTNGVLYIPEHGNTNGYAQSFDGNGLNGGHVFMSSVNQQAIIWSRGVPTSSTAQPVPLYRSDDLGQTTALAPFSPINTTITNLLPVMLYWENFDYQHSIDSITYVARDTLEANSTIWVRSENGRYPFQYTLAEDLNAGDSIKIKDKIFTRLFYGIKSTNVQNSVFMTNYGIQFTKPAVWYKILTPTGIPKSMGLSNDGDYFWVGTRDGKLYRLSNMNQAQDSLSADITSDQCTIVTTEVLDFPGRVVTSIAVDPQNNDHVIITLGNYGNDEYVYRSTNATSDDPEFLSVQGNLPKMPIYSSLIEMKNSNIAILGTEMGVFTTTNLNASQVVWIPQNGAMGDVTVVQLKQQLINTPSVTVPIDSVNNETFPGIDNYGRIYAATFGRGIYKTNHFAIVGINELDGSSKKDIVRLNIYPNPASQNVFIEYNTTKPGQVKVNISDLSGRSVLQKDYRIINSDNNVLQLDISNLKKGVYLISLDNSESIISNKLIVK